MIVIDFYKIVNKAKLLATIAYILEKKSYQTSNNFTLAKLAKKYLNGLT